MQLVTDSGADLIFTPKKLKEIDVEIVPLVVTLDNKSYREGIDIDPDKFYDLLSKTDGLPVTSQPSAGDFAEVYKRLAKTDPEILSIHISSGLSGTFNAAKAGAEMVPEAKVTLFDAKTLSAAVGWMIDAASQAIKAGWDMDKVMGLLDRISQGTDSIYTLKELKYLISGGRISHMKGLIASLLNIKPMIGVEKENGTYIQLGQQRTFNRALDGLVNQITKTHPAGSKLRVQALYSNNKEGAEVLREKVDKAFDCSWLPLGPMSLVLGAHTGPSMVGVAYASEDIFAEIP